MEDGGWATWRGADGKGNEDMKMSPASEQSEMEQLSKYEAKQTKM